MLLELNMPSLIDNDNEDLVKLATKNLNFLQKVINDCGITDILLRNISNGSDFNLATESIKLLCSLLAESSEYVSLSISTYKLFLINS